MAVINSKTIALQAKLADAYSTAEPFRHIVIDDFLDAAFCEMLLNDFPAFEERYALNEMGEVGGKAVRMSVRDVSENYAELDAYLQSTEFLGLVSKVTGIPDLVYDPDYIGGGTHENRQGQSLDAHVDFNYHPRSKMHRRLNLIVYLNPEWDMSWGGSLELHSNPWDAAANRTQPILPLFNRAVIFETTEHSWHGFSRIELPPERSSQSRKSFAIYLYTKERPPSETAPPHATIYVPDPLPPGLIPGKVLEASDVAELHGRFTRLRTQLRYLYEREKQFGAQIIALEGAYSEASDAYRFPLQGYCEQSQAPRGMWADGWVGTDFSVTALLHRAAKGLTLEIWVPQQLGGEQEFEIQLNGQSWSKRAPAGACSKLTLPVRCSAGKNMELRVHAKRSFVPALAGSSGDSRQLAWRLLSATLTD